MAPSRKGRGRYDNPPYGQEDHFPRNSGRDGYCHRGGRGGNGSGGRGGGDRDREATTVIEDETSRVKTYIEALPTCHLLTLGLDFPRNNNRGTMCYCPCSQGMKNWRNLTNVGIESAECTGNGRFDTQMALVDHLRSKKGCLFHLYTLQYLERSSVGWNLKNRNHQNQSELDPRDKYT